MQELQAELNHYIADFPVQYGGQVPVHMAARAYGCPCIWLPMHMASRAWHSHRASWHGQLPPFGAPLQECPYGLCLEAVYWDLSVVVLAALLLLCILLTGSMVHICLPKQPGAHTLTA